ncbi:hypothetical protein OLX41_10150, partial [Streptococcus agalactiae]|uniref:hypothetical protein n=1 Tax=Streptococcus agalactiae TaxID=1311 RepID=UPI0022210E98
RLAPESIVPSSLASFVVYILAESFSTLSGKENLREHRKHLPSCSGRCTEVCQVFGMKERKVVQNSFQSNIHVIGNVRKV